MPNWSYQQVEDVCWAVAARDCAIERGDTDAAALFAQQARDAIADVLATGTTLRELADELDYPGGAAEIDGPHIDHEIATGHPDNPHTDMDTLDMDNADHIADGRQMPPLPAEWSLPPEMLDGMEERRTSPATPDDPAELRARLDALRRQIDDRDDQRDDAGRVNSGGPDVGPGVSLDPDLETVDRDEAGRRLADTLGCDIGTARELVTGYLDDTSRVVGVPVHHWGLDQADVNAIADRYSPFTTPQRRGDEDVHAHEIVDQAASTRSAAVDDSEGREW
jgi:hypothetical protein